MAPDLQSSFVYRVVAFALSGTTLVDLKCTNEDPDCSQQAKLACRLKVSALTLLMTKTVMQRRKKEPQEFGSRVNRVKRQRQYDIESNPNKVSLSDSF